MSKENRELQVALTDALDEINRLRGRVQQAEAGKRTMRVSRDRAKAEVMGLKRELRHMEIGIKALDRAEAA